MRCARQQKKRIKKLVNTATASMFWSGIMLTLYVNALRQVHRTYAANKRGN